MAMKVKMKVMVKDKCVGGDGGGDGDDKCDTHPPCLHDGDEGVVGAFGARKLLAPSIYQ